MKFGEINNYILFGGGDLLLKIALFLKVQNDEIIVELLLFAINSNIVL